ncbi:MAG: Asp-tRNA(Asn)/Glu-tRNA(Gln) amidotransferase subunit GatC [Crocinitomicaceae bacterium]
MEITDDLVDHIAHLARLNFEGSEKEAMKGDMEKIIDFIDQLNKVETDDVEPLIFMSEAINVLRQDEIKQDISQQEALKNAGHHDSDYFKIAKVLDQS